MTDLRIVHWNPSRSYAGPRNIVTSYDPPPIPGWQQYAWNAVDRSTYDGAPDSDTRHQVGYGRTEQEAVAALQAIFDEDADA